MKSLLVYLSLLSLLSTSVVADDVRWDRVQLDARFRSEGVAIGDFNKDGKKDIVAGDYWYAAPAWEKSEIREPGDFWAGEGYSRSFCNWVYDINADGWDDVILVGFPGDPFFWYQNPQGKTERWKEHVIWHSICNESPQFRDLTGDGKPDLVFGSAVDGQDKPLGEMGYIEIPTGDAVYAKWNFVAISEPGDPGSNGTFKYYHGLGVADINADGRHDVVIPHGWWEHPAQRTDAKWAFHAHVLGDGGPKTGADIYTEDLDLDGDTDVLMSCGHQHGVWWFENQEKQGGTGHKMHVIDESFSQTHALHFEDINGDGKKDMITGKRYYAHNGGDPGANDPVVMYWYEIERKAGGPVFTPHEITAGRDTGVGTQFAVGDINGDGKLDIALSNKKGVNILLQRGTGAVAAHEPRSLFDGKTLANWAPAEMRGCGPITVEDGAITVGIGRPMSGVVWTGDALPTVNYEVTLEAQRAEGNDFFCALTFPVSKDPCTLVLGGWGGTLTGLSSLNGADASENQTTGYRDFKKGQWYKLRLRVTDQKIQAWLDDKSLCDVKYKGMRISIRLECDACRPLGIATYDTVGALRNIQHRLLSAQEVQDTNTQETEEQ